MCASFSTIAFIRAARERLAISFIVAWRNGCLHNSESDFVGARYISPETAAKTWARYISPLHNCELWHDCLHDAVFAGFFGVVKLRIGHEEKLFRGDDVLWSQRDGSN